MESKKKGLSLKVLLHEKKKQSNSEVIKKLKMKRELLKKIKNRQVEYFGHMKRHMTQKIRPLNFFTLNKSYLREKVCAI